MEETLGKRISINRKRLALTQDALAEKLGVTAQAVSKWENDQSCPDITMLPKLADIFDITTDELLGVPRKGIATQETAPEAPTQAIDSEAAAPGKWSVLASPGVAFGFWLFLTGLVALIDAVRLPPYDLADISLIHIALCCGIFAFGLSGLFHRFSLLRLGCTLAGGVFLFHLIAEPGIGDMDWRVPLLAGLALLGLDLLIDSIRKPKGSWMIMPFGHDPQKASKSSCTSDDSSFHCWTLFGADNHTIQSAQLSRGKGEVVFGALTIDLCGCGELCNGCIIDLDCAFGAIKLLIPRKYRVERTASSLFSAIEDHGSPSPDGELIVYVNCEAAFGSITIHYI